MMMIGGRRSLVRMRRWKMENRAAEDVNNDWLSVRTSITTEFYFGYSLYGSCFPVTHLVVTSCFNRFCKPEISKTLGNQKSHVVPLFCELSHVHLPLIVCFR